jgi:hypothetical protein
MDHDATIRRLLDRHGTTYAEQAGIQLADRPAPLWQLLVLSQLLSARISSGTAVEAARELFRARYRTPPKMRTASWQHRLDTFGLGHNRRYDRHAATMLGDAADVVLAEHRGDLRELHAGTDDLERDLQKFKGIGATGAAIFCREVQGVWPDIAPYVDNLAADGAERVGLPRSAHRLAELVPAPDLPRLVAACVRAARSKDVVQDVRRA